MKRIVTVMVMAMAMASSVFAFDGNIEQTKKELEDKGYKVFIDDFQYSQVIIDEEGNIIILDMKETEPVIVIDLEDDRLNI